MSQELTREEAAVRAKVRPDTWSAYVSRGQAPSPTRHLARTPLWDASEVDQWIAARPGRGRRSSRQLRDHGAAD